MNTYGKSLGFILGLIGLIAPVAQASEFEDFAKNEMEMFTQYRDERDAEFISFLKAQWQEFQAYKGLVRDTTPKPKRVPNASVVVTSKSHSDVSTDTKETTPEKKIETSVVEKIVVPRLPETLPSESEGLPTEELSSGETQGETPEVEALREIAPAPAFKPVMEPQISLTSEPFVGVAFEFFGSDYSFAGDFKFPHVTMSGAVKEVVSDYWEKMSQCDYEAFLSKVGRVKKKQELNDWGYHALLYSAGMKIHGGDRDLANLFVWFMSLKSGYDAKAGYSDERVYLLLPSRNRLYGVSYLTIKGMRYYAMTFDGTKEKLTRLFTYKASYPRSNKLMDYRILKTPTLAPEIVDKELSFDYSGEKQLIHISYNKALVTYFENYPQTNIKIYFDAGTSRELDYTMVRELQKVLEGKSEVEAVNYLLGFVQKAFKYKTDDAQLGHEKYMLPEETLWYPYSDCEDRSFLFAYLVRKVLKLDVVGLNYPGHVATAVRFSDNISGDYVVTNNRKYIVCDPTYINASAGMAMPQFKRRNPDVVKIRNWR